MIAQRLPVVLFCLIKALEAAVPSRSDLDTLADTATVSSIPQLSDQLAQLEIKGPEVKADNAEPLLSFFEISEKMEALIKKISALDTNTAVETIEKRLVQLLDSGVCLNDIAPTIGSFPIDAKELVLAALELKAHTLLNLLQMVYVWRDDHQYHWFIALVENESWRNRELKNDLGLFPLNWRNNLRAICEADNGALAVATRNNVPFGDALESFDKELLLLCAEYDSIRVFESTQLNPVKLGEHFELLAKNSAAKLLQSYQNHIKIPHLHLEEFLLPTKLPKDVEDFKFLMENGYNYLPMDEFIGKFCREGRLDLLQYLQTLNPVLIPEILDLQYAAEENFKDILDWARQSGMEDFKSFDYHICQTLLANKHFDTLLWWMDVNEIIIDQHIILTIARSGELTILEAIPEKQLAGCNLQRVANAAVEKQRLPILEWLYEKYKILPDAENLGYATGEMLDWMKSKSETIENPFVAMGLAGVDLRYKDLLTHGASNFELVQWVFKHAPVSVLDKRKEILSDNTHNKEMMLWLYANLNICPSETLFWAYRAGDLEAAQWAADKCGVYPTEWGTISAAEGGHLDMIMWIHKTAYPNNPLCFSIKTLNAAITNGHLEIADYLSTNVFPGEKPDVSIKTTVGLDKRLSILKWAHEHKFIPVLSQYEVGLAAQNEDMQTLEWFYANFSVSSPISEKEWISLVRNDWHKSYQWFLEKYPNVRDRRKLIEDVSMAYKHGSLGILKVLYEKNPLVLFVLSQRLITKANYHANQWLAAHGYLVKQA